MKIIGYPFLFYSLFQSLLNQPCCLIPAKIIQVPDIPYTLNMKKVEGAVTNVIHGKPVLNRDALVNPESLDYYSGLEELQS